MIESDNITNDFDNESLPNLISLSSTDVSTETNYYNYYTNESRKKKRHAMNIRKYQHAYYYIKYVASILGDLSPKDHIIVLPFGNVKELYEDYLDYCKSLFSHTLPAESKIFKNAFVNFKKLIEREFTLKGLQKSVKFTTCDNVNK
jgi:hypothetical protein